MKSDVRFEEKLALGSKSDMRNLVNFDGRSGKSENVHFDVVLLFLIAYIVSASKVPKSCLSWQWKKIQTLIKKPTLCFENDMRSFVNFNASIEKNENLQVDSLLL